MLNHSFDVLINSYLLHQIGIDPSFLSKELATGLQQHLLELSEDGLLKSAGVGNAFNSLNPQTMRGDAIYWMDKSHTNRFEQSFLLQIDELVSYLNETCYTGISGYEFHYALYDTGSRYKRHKDQFNNNNHRKFSLINYLNNDWLPSDGGALLAYPDAGTASILPQHQTAVFFKSDELEHEVSAATRPRLSITGWLKSN